MSPKYTSQTTSFTCIWSSLFLASTRKSKNQNNHLHKKRCFFITILQSNSKQYLCPSRCYLFHIISKRGAEVQRSNDFYLSVYLFMSKKVRRLNLQFEGTGRHKEKPEEMIKEELREVFRKIKLPKVACASE